MLLFFDSQKIVVRGVRLGAPLKCRFLMVRGVRFGAPSTFSQVHPALHHSPFVTAISNSNRQLRSAIGVLGQGVRKYQKIFVFSDSRKYRKLCYYFLTVRKYWFVALGWVRRGSVDFSWFVVLGWVRRAHLVRCTEPYTTHHS